MQPFEDGFVLPKPGIPRTLGILNIIFGVFGILTGLCLVTYTVAMPLTFQFAGKAVKEEQEKTEAANKAKLAEFDSKLASAKSDEEKTSIQKEKDTYVSNTPPDLNMDFDEMTATMRSPVIIGHTCAYNGLGVLVNIFLIISGIGLLNLSGWGRSMALWLAGITILLLAILAAVDLLVVQPVYMDLTAKMLVKLEEATKVQGAPPSAGGSIQAAKLMGMMGGAKALGAFVFLSIYPVVTLILLTRPGARAACLARSEKIFPGQ